MESLSISGEVAEKTSTLRAVNWPIKTRLPRLVRSLTLGLLLLCPPAIAQQFGPVIDWGPVLDIPRSEEVIRLTLVEDSVPALVTQFGEALIMRTFREPQQEFPLFIRTDVAMSLKTYKVHNDRMYVVEGSSDVNDHTLQLLIFHLTSDKADNIYTASFTLNKLKKAPSTSELQLNHSPSGVWTVVCQQESFTKQSKAVFNLLATNIDTTLQLQLPTEYDGDDVELLGCTIDDNGIVYLGALAGVKLNSPFRRKYIIYSYNAADSTLTEFDLSSQDLFIHDLIVSVYEDGLHVTGLYHSDPLEQKSSIGYLYIKLSGNGKEIEQRIVSTFSIGLIQAHEGADASPENGIKDLYLNRLLFVDNQPLIQLEKRFKDQICTADPRTGMLNCTDQYHYDGVSFIDVRKQRALLTIEKRQLDYDRVSNFSGHVSMNVSNAEGLVLYNDHFKNERLKADRIMNNPNRSSLRSVVIHADGAISTHLLTNERQADFVFTPAYGAVSARSTVFILTQSNRNFRVGKVNIRKL